MMFEAIALNLKTSPSNFQLQTQKEAVAKATASFAILLRGNDNRFPKRFRWL